MTRLVHLLVAATTAVSPAVGASAGTAWAANGSPAAEIRSGWVRSDYDTYRGAALDYTVTGALAGRTGNAHKVSFLLAWGDEFGMRLQITDFRCPAGNPGLDSCTVLTQSTAYGDSSGLHKVGRMGVDIDTTVSGPSGTYPVRMRLRQSGPATGWLSAGQVNDSGAFQSLTDDAMTEHVAATGRLGPLNLASPAATRTRAFLQSILGYVWTGPGARTTEHRGTTWTKIDDSRTEWSTWRRAGTVTGRPGNAHTGWVSAEVIPAEGTYQYTQAEWNDWSCPSGVTPPEFALLDSGCTLLRTEHGGSNTLTGAYAGSLGIRVTRRLPTSVITTVGTSRSTASLDVTLQPAGDRTGEVTIRGDRKVVDYDWSAATMTGRLGWVDAGTVTTGRGGAHVHKFFRQD